MITSRRHVAAQRSLIGQARWLIKRARGLTYPDGRDADLLRRSADIEWRIAQAHAWLLVQTRHAQAAEVVQLRPNMLLQRQAQ